MKRFLFIALACALAICHPAAAGSDKPVVIVNGHQQQLPAGDTLLTSAPTSGNASINLPHGTAPTSPANGDVWTTTAGLFVQVNGATIGPLSTGGGSAANPTATASDTAVNGSASTFMRSDAAPAIQKGSTSVFGIVKCDGTTINCTSGVISASGSSGGYEPSLYHSGGVLGPATSGNTASSYQAAILAEASLVAYWKFDDPTGSTTVADSKGSNTGTLITGRGAVFGFPGRLSGTTCAFNAVAVGSTNGSYSVSRPVQDDFTLEAWVLLSEQGSVPGTNWYQGFGIVGLDATGTNADYGMTFSGSRIAAGTGNPDVTAISSASTPYLDGRWHHTVFTRVKSTGAITLYIDGASVATATGSTATLTASATIQLAGFRGFICDVAAYNTALSSTTVLAHYNAGKPH